MIPAQYDFLSKVFHWIMALLIPGLLFVGFTGIGFQWHKSFGMVAGILILARILWRLWHRAPPYPIRVARSQVIAGKAVHLALYFLMVMMPVLGVLGASLSGRPLLFFNIPLPVFNPNKFLAHELFYWHGVLAWGMLVLIILHLFASFLHIFRRDGVVKRMWF
jgi:cytochrome b561